MGSAPDARRKRWLRFLLGGVVNTAFSYAVYLALNTVFAYQLAFFVAYALGVVFSYWFNATVVFQVSLSWKGLLSFPAVYFVQYVASAFSLGGLVELAGIAESWAPLLVALLMLPVTYVMSKFVLWWASRPKNSGRQDEIEHNRD